MGKTSGRQNKSLADFAERDSLRFVRERGGETCDWLTERLEAELKGLVMDWHDEACAGHVGHCDRLFRRAMDTDSRLISAHAHDREIVLLAVAQLREIFR